MLRQFLTYNLAFLLLLTNIGIPVFKHVCHTQEKSWSSLYVPAKSCCKKEKNTGGLCHLPPADNQTEFSSKPCCENHNGLIRLDIEFYCSYPGWDQSEQQVVAFADHIPVFSLSAFTPLFHSTGSPHGPPVILHGRSLLIAQQVFRC